MRGELTTAAWGEILLPVGIGAVPFADDRDWVRLAVIVGAALAVYFLYRARIQLLRRHNRALQSEVERRRAAEEEAREMGMHALHAQEEERKRIAHELHDDIGQQMALLVLQFQSARNGEDRARSVMAVRAVGREIQRISHVLHPAWVETVGLVPALESLTGQVADHTDADVEVSLELDGTALDAKSTLALYRIAQEALSNSVRSSHATRLEVALRRAGDALELVVSDNGTGFDLAAVGSGLGIVGMRERARAIGARLTINSGPRDGTQVRVTLDPPACDPSARTEGLSVLTVRSSVANR